MPRIGEELLDVPFPEMVKELMLAIAQGQTAMDMESISVAQALAETTLPAESVIVAIKETRDEEGNLKKAEPVFNDVEMPLLVYGISPTFYNVTEGLVEVKISITMTSERSYERETNVTSRVSKEAGVKAKASASWLWGKASIEASAKKTSLRVSSVNAKYSQKYGYKAEGASLLRVTIKPVPPPEGVTPVRITVEEPSPPG
jgi:hypothetical protein